MNKLLAALVERHFAPIDFPVFGVENVAAVPMITVLLHVADDGHAEDFLILAFVRTFGATAIGRIRGVQAFDDFAAERTVRVLRDLYERFWLMRMIVNRLPDADWRVGALRKGYRRARQQHCGRCHMFHREQDDRAGRVREVHHVVLLFG